MNNEIDQTQASPTAPLKAPLADLAEFREIRKKRKETEGAIPVWQPSVLAVVGVFAFLFGRRAARPRVRA